MGLTGGAAAPGHPAAPAHLETLVTGTGGPVTVVAHGLGGSIAQTRPLAGGLAGTRVHYAARGHGASPLGEEPVTYELLRRDLLAVADAVRATRAIGVSMGAGTLLSLMAVQPARLDRAVLFLPGSIDRPRRDEAVRRLGTLAQALEAADRPAVEALVAAEVPTDLPPGPVAAYVKARSAYLLASPGVAALLRTLPLVSPVRQRTLLVAVQTQVLVLAQEGDPLHPAQVARDLVAVLPRARLVVFDRPGAAFRERARLRELVVDFLGD